MSDKWTILDKLMVGLIAKSRIQVREINEYADRGYWYIQKHPLIDGRYIGFKEDGQVTTFYSNTKARYYKPEPELVEHWPAVIKNKYTKGSPKPGALFRSEEDADTYYHGTDFGLVKLATEYPPIMLEIKE